MLLSELEPWFRTQIHTEQKRAILSALLLHVCVCLHIGLLRSAQTHANTINLLHRHTQTRICTIGIGTRVLNALCLWSVYTCARA